MKEDIAKMFIANMCSDLEDVILNGLEEEKEQLPFSTACINFIYELKEQGVNVNMNYFSEQLRDNVYNEIKRYLVR